ncbi:hypothetical protein RZN22_17795 [Bacillaceae bacterium S4-13-58]
MRGLFFEYVTQRLNLIKDKIDAIDVVLQCPKCFQEAAEFNDSEDSYCYFCDEEIENFQEDYIFQFVETYSAIKDGGESPLLECPDCNDESFICLDGYQYICLSCGIKPTQDDITTCNGPVCNEKIVYILYTNDGGYEPNLCHLCMDYFKNA